MYIPKQKKNRIIVDYEITQKDKVEFGDLHIRLRKDGVAKTLENGLKRKVKCVIDGENISEKEILGASVEYKGVEIKGK